MNAVAQGIGLGSASYPACIAPAGEFDNFHGSESIPSFTFGASLTRCTSCTPHPVISLLPYWYFLTFCQSTLNTLNIECALSNRHPGTTSDISSAL
jgi:hypothetical protein